MRSPRNCTRMQPNNTGAPPTRLVVSNAVLVLLREAASTQPLLVILEIEAAKQAIIVGHEQDRADRRREAVDCESFWRLGLGQVTSPGKGSPYFHPLACQQPPEIRLSNRCLSLHCALSAHCLAMQHRVIPAP